MLQKSQQISETKKRKKYHGMYGAQQILCKVHTSYTKYIIQLGRYTDTDKGNNTIDA